MLTFGERLRMARERAGLSQLDVYKAINLSNKSLSRYENNATAPDPDTVRALIELYDVSADFIMGLSDEMGRARPSKCGTSKSKPKLAEAVASGDKELIKKLESLSPEAAVTIRNWQNTVMSAINPRTGKKYSETYIRSINSRLSAIFNYAVKFYNLQSNPCHPAGFMGKKKAGKMKFWTLDEFNQAMVHVTNWSFRVAFMLMYWLGLREGECLALQPADILSTKVARIEKTHHRRKGEDKNGPPKTDNSYRDVSMPDFLYDEVLRYIDALYDIDKHDRIFYFQKGTLGRTLNEAANAAGVKRIRVHDLRHSHAALLVELGYSIVAVAERLGDTVEVAMSTYAHLYPNKMEQVAADLNKQATVKNETPTAVVFDLEKVEKKISKN